MAIEIQKVGVIGAGQMGNGIAQVCALAGLDVLINDVSQDRLHAGLATVDGAMARDALALFPDGAMKAAMLETVDFCIARSH
jgi:3-hydroxybutyryl-CoA dehydrogenase